MKRGDEYLFALEGLRADGWLDRLLEGDADQARVADVVGAPFVAFAFVAGVKLTGLDGDLERPESTLVDFRVGDDATEQRLGLGEFRRRLAAALLSDEPLPLPPPGPDAADADVEGFLGPQLLLLAPVFGLQLEALGVRQGRATVAMREVPVEGTRGRPGVPDASAVPEPPEPIELPLEELRERIRDGIQHEVERVRESSTFSIELGVVSDAESALAAGEPRRVVALLGAWPGPLTMLLRTPQGAALAQEVRVTLARALGLLGTAYVGLERFEWAEETLRLGVQFVQEGAAAGDLYRRLGECYATQGRSGEAIGPLRRAIGLGIDESRVLPLLAHAYAARGRQVAAAACAERAIAQGVDVESMRTLRDHAAGALGEPWTRFRERYPMPDADASGVPSTPGDEPSTDDGHDRLTPEIPPPDRG